MFVEGVSARGQKTVVISESLGGERRVPPGASLQNKPNPHKTRQACSKPTALGPPSSENHRLREGRRGRIWDQSWRKGRTWVAERRSWWEAQLWPRRRGGG